MIFRKRDDKRKLRLLSSLFDEAFYLDQLQAGDAPPQDEASALEHYLLHGLENRRSPHPLFDADFYLSANPDVDLAAINPLEHYLTQGWKDGRDPNFLFDSTYYTRQLRLPDDLPPVQHYLASGEAAGLRPHPLFDPERYRRELGEPHDNCLAHYLTKGWKEGRTPHPLFDPAFYLARNPDVAASAMNPLFHFLRFGWREGRDPHLLFSTRHYLAQLGAEAEALADPLSHYVETGWRAELDPHPVFDAAFYASQLPEGESLAVSHLEHYLAAGWRSGLDPHPWFQVAFYLYENPDVLNGGLEPLTHYLAHGWRECRRTNPYFFPRYYAAARGRDASAERSPLEQYLTSAPAERISPNPFLTAEALDALLVGKGPPEGPGACAYTDFDLELIREMAANEERILDELRHAEPGLAFDATFIKAFPALARRVAKRLRFAKDSGWKGRPVKVGFAVSEVGVGAARGDYFTAQEMADALHELFGWETTFLSQNIDWYQVSEVDVLIALIDSYDLRLRRRPLPGQIAVAWLRNWFDSWVEQDCVHGYGLLLCSSKRSLEFVRSKGLFASLFPLATNHRRFTPKAPPVGMDVYSDCCFTGNNWGIGRGFAETFDPADVPCSFSVYGCNWFDHPVFARHWRGRILYHDLPALYGHSRIVIDDANDATREWGSLNSRVFDALVTGSLVVTNNPIGGEELFHGELPCYHDKDSLNALLRHYLNNDAERGDLVKRLQQEVLERHTYDERARTFQALLLETLRERCSFAIKIGVPDMAELELWGDYHFARDLQAALEREGHTARIDILPQWYERSPFDDDVVIVLRGLSKYEPRPGQLNFLWLISHPELAQPEELERYDQVFVASTHYAAVLREQLKVPVEPLLQCTNPDRFHPVERDAVGHDLLFVGKSRGVYREVVKHCVDSGLDVAIHGNDWESFVDAKFIHSEYLNNDLLHRHYACSKIVLCDHWPDMRDLGFVSNRLFDCLACKGLPLCDNARGLKELFGDAVPVYTDLKSFQALVADMLDRHSIYQSKVDVIFDRVVQEHTFTQRVKIILEKTRQCCKLAQGGAPDLG